MKDLYKFVAYQTFIQHAAIIQQSSITFRLIKQCIRSISLTFLFIILSAIAKAEGTNKAEGFTAGVEGSQAYRIYLDADQTNNKQSGQAIKLGIEAAFSEVNWKLGNTPVQLVVKDHHGSTVRSKYHLEQFAEDERALAVFGGLHSPPLIQSRDYINDNQILTLVPWAAATPITRAKDKNNWIFRLSIDDSKAGKVIIDELINDSKLKHPFLVLEDSGWGKANQKTMSTALAQFNHKMAGIRFFRWGIGQLEAKTILENAIDQGADSIVLVANAPEGITFANAMLDLDPSKQLPIRSHWGITGGNFASSLGEDALAKLDLRFIQTSFSFFNSPHTPVAKQALIAASRVKNTGSISAQEIKAPTGFIHAYDLTKLLIAAAKQSSLSGEIVKDRVALKEALENLQSQVSGLIKTYVKPFSGYTKDEKDAHEALDASDFTMAFFDKHGNIRLIK